MRNGNYTGWNDANMNIRIIAGRPLCAGWLLCVLTVAGRASESDLPPAYVPQQQVTGRIVIWGHGSLGNTTDFIEGLTRSWEAGFGKFQPGVTFENRLYGTASAIGALYTRTGDLALMGREIWPHEVAAFEEVFHYLPTGIDVLTGSFDVRNRGYAIVIFVHKDNPLAALTLAQLDALYGVERRRGGAPLHTWGDLGLKGEWRDEPIHLYGLPIARGFAEYIEDRVFLGSRKWNPQLREFSDQRGSTGGATDGGQQMLDALAQDRYGIGYAGLVYHHPEVKPLALAEADVGPYVLPTQGTVLNHSYPLTRTIKMYLNRVPGAPTDPKLKEFLRYVLSREGQESVQRDGRGYLPMLAPFAKNERSKLE
jgi:phosphate transport system substrate-binding protein